MQGRNASESGMGRAEPAEVKAKILVADDVRDVRELCVRTLRKAGYDVTGVSNGVAAVELARVEAFDLFLTDVKMPGMTGLEAYRLIRESSPGTTAVVITGFGTTELAIKALTLGVAEFLLKPFTPAELRAAIERALHRQELEHENARLKALIPLFKLSQAFMTTVDLSILLERIVHIAAEETGADRCSLMLLDEKAQELSVGAAKGLSADVIAAARQSVGDGVSGWVMEHGEPAIIQGSSGDDPRFRDAPHWENLETAICLPLKSQDRPIGVLSVAKGPKAVSFTESEVELLSVLGSQAAIAIENARLFQQTQEAYERLSELDHMKSEFISIAAHELRTPLAVVLAYVSLVEEEVSDPLKEHLSVVTQAATQLKSIIDDMLSLSHVQAGQARLQIADVTIAKLVATVLADIAPLVEGKGHTVATDLPSELPSVRADPEKLGLVVSNLVSNAVKFTPSGGHIEIGARVQGDEVVLRVSDDGIGITEEAKGRVFDRFYQVEESLRREHQGIGLGLPIAKAMVELHGGSIWVESVPGQGSTFFFRIPIEGPPAEWILDRAGHNDDSGKRVVASGIGKGA